jgi:hypothetical protein
LASFSSYLRKELEKEKFSEEEKEVGDDVKSSWPLQIGLHTCYKGTDKEKLTGNRAQSSKLYRSPD